MKHIFFSLAIIFSVFARAQQTLIIKVIDGKTGQPIESTIQIEKSKILYTDSSGIATVDFIKNGTYNFHSTAIGYVEDRRKIMIPYFLDTLLINLEVKHEELEEVTIRSTRTGRTIANVPTRVETIDPEEIDEKNNMRPGNVAMLLHESTGIQVQQTSATSANASIRMQGLDGRYTQLLKDGFGNFGNFSSGLSVLEIPPLDLRQVEIIKGPASPLFGGGAIAGVVNFISKSPKDKPEYSLLINQSHIGQRNIGGFASQKGKKIGYTFLALYTKQKPFDVDKDDFTELPKTDEFTLHPKIFFYPSENIIIQIGSSLSREKRMGGDIYVVKNKPDSLHQYFEKNKTLRNISTFELNKKFQDHRSLAVKQSFSVFDRTIDIPGYNFAGREYNAYTDISYVSNMNKHAFVVGSNFIYTDFNERDNNNDDRNNKTTTGGIYAQHTLDATDRIKLESGLRLDVAHYHNPIYSNTEFFLLPRISVLIRYNSKWTSRVGGGMGYKTPTLFTEEAETMHYENIQQLNSVTSEKSYGGTADVNFKTNISDKLSFTFNHMFFYTMIDKPVVLDSTGSVILKFINADKPVITKGFETNARLVYNDNFKLFLGYTFTDARAQYRIGKQFLPLVPKSKLNIALIYEKEEKLKLGLEGYITGRQYLSDGSPTPSVSELGFMAEKIFRQFSVFINFENFTDTRQSRYKAIVSGSHLNPTFDEIWTHTEGFVINGGLKIKF